VRVVCRRKMVFRGFKGGVEEWVFRDEGISFKGTLVMLRGWRVDWAVFGENGRQDYLWSGWGNFG
jgi:hypothetical protein